MGTLNIFKLNELNVYLRQWKYLFEIIGCYIETQGENFIDSEQKFLW